MARYLDSLLEGTRRLHAGGSIVAEGHLSALSTEAFVNRRLHVERLFIDDLLALHVEDDPGKLENLLLLGIIDLRA